MSFDEYNIDEEFRKRAHKKFGIGKGALAKALTEAIQMWCDENENG